MKHNRATKRMLASGATRMRMRISAGIFNTNTRQRHLVNMFCYQTEAEKGHGEGHDGLKGFITRQRPAASKPLSRSGRPRPRASPSSKTMLYFQTSILGPLLCAHKSRMRIARTHPRPFQAPERLRITYKMRVQSRSSDPSPDSAPYLHGTREPRPWVK